METAKTTDPDSGSAPRATLEELAAEPERVANEAAARPVRIERPNGTTLVLLDAEAFDRLHHPGRPEALPIEAMTDRELEVMDAHPGPTDLPEFADDEPLVWHG